MRRTICSLALLMLSIQLCFAQQKLTFSDEILNTKDVEIVAIKELWSQFYDSIKKTKLTNARPIYDQYWMPNDSIDLVGHSMSTTYAMYLFGDSHTFSIRKYNSSTYEVNTILWMNPEKTDMYCIYKVCATKDEHGTYKLHNYATKVLADLQTEQIGNITYYYPCGLEFSQAQKDKVLGFIADIVEKYAIDSVSNIRYIVGNSIDECQRYLGFPYTIMRSEYKTAGMYVYPDIIISCRPDHIHELVHRLFITKEQPELKMLHEGLAMYYGGTGDLTNKEHIEVLRKYLQEHPLINLSEYNSYQILLPGGSNPFYSVGYLLIEEAMKRGKEKKVKALFSHNSMDDVFVNEFNVKAEEVEAFLLQLLDNFK